ncbi:MAG: hypothetical protein EPO36_06805 [Chloroflexota bacterium]|nr:MAG: hypothetical protein EPO36_06805 [Chloroflexota bacterium]
MMTRLAWIAAIIVGLAAGGFAFHFPGSYGNPVLDPSAAVVGILIGGVNGLLVGALVWMALRLSRAAGPRVLAASVVLIGLTHAMNDASSTRIPFLVVEAVAGVVAAGTAVWILRERRPRVVIVAGVAWTAGIVLGGWSGDWLGLPLSETPIGWSVDHAWDGLITGLVWGVATATIGLPDALRRDTAGRSTLEPAYE